MNRERVYRDRKALLGNERPLDECSARFQLAFRLIRSKDNASLRSYLRQLDGTKYTTSIEAMSVDLVVVISGEESSPFCIHARAPQPSCKASLLREFSVLCLRSFHVSNGKRRRTGSGGRDENLPFIDDKNHKNWVFVGPFSGAARRWLEGGEKLIKS